MFRTSQIVHASTSSTVTNFTVANRPLLRCAANTSRVVLRVACAILFCAPMAQAADYTPPAAYDSWLANVFYTVALATAVVILFQKIWPKREPTIEREFVSKADLEKWCALRHGGQESDIQALTRRFESAELSRVKAERIHEERAAKLHERVDRLTRVTYSIAGKLGINTAE